MASMFNPNPTVSISPRMPPSSLIVVPNGDISQLNSSQRVRGKRSKRRRGSNFMGELEDVNDTIDHS
jgi:hypothetical protein